MCTDIELFVVVLESLNIMVNYISASGKYQILLLL